MSTISTNASRFAELNETAAQYGYGVDEDGRIILSSGKLSSATITPASTRAGSKRFKVVTNRPGRGEVTLFTGDDLGMFLERFWFARKLHKGGD